MNEQDPNTKTQEKIISGIDGHNLQLINGGEALYRMGERQQYDNLTLDEEPNEEPFVPLSGKSGEAQVLSEGMKFEMPGRYNQSEVINTSEQVKNPNILKRIGGAAARVLHIVKPS